MAAPRIFLSVVIPAYNEADRIEHTLRAVSEYLSDQRYSSEIIVVDDGSTDDTAARAEKFAAPFKHLRVIVNSVNRGKGAVVRQGMREAKGNIRLFMDADNSTTIDHVERMLPEFEKGAEVVIGSRRVPGARIAVHQNFIRETIGRVFHLVVYLFTGLPMADTQAGFKAFSAKAAEDIFSRITIERFAFDVEALLIAKRLGFRIAEVPITWINVRKSHVKFLDMWKMLFEVIKIRRIWRGKK